MVETRNDQIYMIPTLVSSGGRQGKRGPELAADNSDLKLRVGHQMIHNLPAGNRFEF